MKRLKTGSNSQVMWLQELLGIDYSNFTGDGYFSHVYYTNRNTVLKLTVDEVYMEYIETVSTMDNKYLPKLIKNFGCIGSFGKHKHKLYAIELPLYTGIGEDIFSDPNMGYDDLANTAESMKDFLNNCQIGGEPLGVRLSRRSGTDAITTFCQELNLDYFEFLDAIHFIMNKFNDKKGSYIDTHLGNFMVDDNGVIKITDPVASRKASGGMGGGFDRRKSLGSMLYGFDLGKLEEIRGILDSDKTTAMFAKFKATVNTDLPCSVNFQHLNLDRQKYESKIEVQLDGTTLGWWETYEKVKKRKESLQSKKVVLCFKEDGKEKQVTLKGVNVDEIKFG